jgi:dTDP-glucose pyrophosphorylase
MIDWKSVLISPHSTLRDALKVINSSRSQFAMVVDDDGRLLGTLSDGDIRRGLLDNASLADAVDKFMCHEPKVAKNGQLADEILALIKHSGLHQIPIVDANLRVIGLKTLDDFLTPAKRENPVVIMAGGLGTRLHELTREKPKPMLSVGGRPILEMIINRFVTQGFLKIWLAVNYRAEIIERYFGNGQAFGAEIQYLRESKRLGTAGALSLLPQEIKQPVIVSNADLVSFLDYPDLLNAHVAAGASATMAVREYEHQIPYGVVREMAGIIKQIEEKPVQRVLVNAGLYVLSPEVIRHVPRNIYFDMTQLFDKLIQNPKPVICYRLNGYWIDIGHLKDYEKVKADFSEGIINSL